jgi:hypothetical protein
VFHRVPLVRKPLYRSKAEQQVMLPGIRFLCAAVVLAVSLVIFGMGAAALLRSAHEEFASLPNRRPPVPVFSPQPEPPPSLAMLRFEPRVTEAAEPVVATAPEASTPMPTTGQADLETNQPAPETIITAAVASAVEPGTPVVEAAPAQPGGPAMIAAAPAETSEPAAAPQSTPAPETTASISLPTATIMELPTATLTAEDARLSSSKVALLGGPPIDTEPVPLPNSRPTAEPPKAKPVKKVVKKPAMRQRRLAARATPAAAPVAPQQVDPFGLSQIR